MRLYLDACTIIYAVEGHPHFGKAVLAKILQAQQTPDGLIIVSRLARLECLVLPVRNHDTAMLAQYNAFFAHSQVAVLEVSAAILERATLLRADSRFKTPDAIHLATPIEANADLFLTGDSDLARCPGLAVEVVL